MLGGGTAAHLLRAPVPAGLPPEGLAALLGPLGPGGGPAEQQQQLHIGLARVPTADKTGNLYVARDGCDEMQDCSGDQCSVSAG